MTLLVALVLVAANGMFVAMEFALLTSLRTRIEPLADAGSFRADVALSSMRRIGIVLAGSQLGITMASLGLGSVAEPELASIVERAAGALGLGVNFSRTIGVVLGLAIVVFVHLVLGEMVPKSLALAHPERTLVALAVPAGAFVVLFRPVIWLLNRLAGLGARVVGVRQSDEMAEAATIAQFGVMLEESLEEGLLESEEHDLLLGALGFLERHTSEVMVPRSEIRSIRRSATVADAESVIRRSGHSRVLVTGRDIDDVVGFVHVKDLIRLPLDRRQRPVPLSAFRPTMTLRPDEPLGDVLLAMRDVRRHVALVVDDARRTVGMVTLEDVLEAIVGDIVDETDRIDSSEGRVIEDLDPGDPDQIIK